MQVRRSLPPPPRLQRSSQSGHRGSATCEGRARRRVDTRVKKPATSRQVGILRMQCARSESDPRRSPVPRAAGLGALGDLHRFARRGVLPGSEESGAPRSPFGASGFGRCCVAAMLDTPKPPDRIDWSEKALDFARLWVSGTILPTAVKTRSRSRGGVSGPLVTSVTGRDGLPSPSQAVQAVSGSGSMCCVGRGARPRWTPQRRRGVGSGSVFLHPQLPALRSPGWNEMDAATLRTLPRASRGMRLAVARGVRASRFARPSEETA